MDGIPLRQHFAMANHEENPDDLVVCPIDPGHVMKRKTLPYHVPKCHAENGKHMLPCRYSQYHFEHTKEDLIGHELVCPNRNQLDNYVLPAPAYNRVHGDLGVSRLSRASAERKKEAAVVANHGPTSGYGSLRQDPPHEIHAPSDATKRLGPFLENLTRTALFSYERPVRLLGSDESVETYDGRYRHDLAALEEEDEEAEEGNQAETLSASVGFRRQNAGFPSDQTQPYLELTEEYNDAEFTCRSIAEKDFADYGNTIPRDIARRYHRDEDDRDAEDDPEKRAAYTIDWNRFPKLYRPILRKKFARDQSIHATGVNPRYVKQHDCPQNTFQAPDPRQFQDLSAWYEDLIYKPQKTDSSLNGADAFNGFNHVTW